MYLPPILQSNLQLRELSLKNAPYPMTFVICVLTIFSRLMIHRISWLSLEGALDPVNDNA